LDIEHDLPVTSEDVEALRRLRAETPSWFSVDWRELDGLVTSDALDLRSLADDTWVPFSLD